MLGVVSGLFGAAGAQGLGVATRSRSVACNGRVQAETTLTGVRSGEVSVPGTPFDVVGSRDGRFSFVSLVGRPPPRPSVPSGTDGRIAVYANRGLAPALLRVIPVSRRLTYGEAVTPDGRYLLVTDTSSGGVFVVSIPRAETGVGDAVLGHLAYPGRAPPGSIEVASSRDGRFVFLSDEFAGTIAVFDLRVAMADHFRRSGFVGTIPLHAGVVGLAVSPNGKWLYATSEAGVRGAPVGPGGLSVIDMPEAIRAPARSVRITVRAGCDPVRVTVAPNGRVVWVTARESNALLAFSAANLISNTRHALLGWVHVGSAPIGVAVTRHGQRVIVAASNRFHTPGATTKLSVIQVPAALLDGKPGRLTVLGAIPAGSFPREITAEANGYLAVANFGSQSIELVDPQSIP